MHCQLATFGGRILSKRASQHAVISVYRDDPTYLTDLFPQHTVYENLDNPTESPRNPRWIAAPNTGHSLGNFFGFILDNYDELPDTVVFLKSNIVPRHVFELNALKRLCREPGLVQLWHDPNYLTDGFQSDVSGSGRFLERNNSWFMKAGGSDKQSRYFDDLDFFLEFVFPDYKPVRWIEFAPGACYSVPRANILKRSRGYYSFMHSMSTYSYFPLEAYLVERALQLGWETSLLERQEIVKGDWEAALHEFRAIHSNRLNSAADRLLSSALHLIHVTIHRRQIGHR
jgi:hypothetical protein